MKCIPAHSSSSSSTFSFILMTIKFQLRLRAEVKAEPDAKLLGRQVRVPECVSAVALAANGGQNKYQLRNYVTS